MYVSLLRRRGVSPRDPIVDTGRAEDDATIPNGGHAKIDPRDQAAYSIGEAARFLKVPAATLRTWTLGRQYRTSSGRAQSQALIRPASTDLRLLSFWNLIEAHVLRALRTEHGVSLQAVRDALRYAEEELRVDRLLLRPDLRSKAGHLFLDRYGHLINLSVSGQLAMRQVLEAHLDRIEWDRSRFPVRLHPFTSTEIPSPDKPIAIDPTIAFGRPVLVQHGISTAAIVDRIDAGESPEHIARDYGMTADDVAQAVLYERAV